MKTKKSIKKAIIASIIFSVIPINTFAISVYNTKTNENFWESGYANMPTSRDSLTTSSVNDKIYAIGGYTPAYGAISTVEMYDPKTDRWETKAPMPTKRDNLSSAVVDGKIYAIGGLNQATKTYHKDIEVYDPTTNTWETKTPMPTGRYGAASAVVDGKIYVIGGQTSSSSRTNVVEVYDPKTDTWETKTPMLTGRSNLTAAAINGKIYCVGGWDSNANVLTTLEVYDPATDTWERKKSMSKERVFLASAVVTNKMYIIGGYDKSNRLSIVEEYDPKTDTWTSKANMIKGRSSLGCSVANGRIYCIGGRSATSHENTVEAYLPKSADVINADTIVSLAEATKNPADIEAARDTVNKLPESADKDALQDRLNSVIVSGDGPLTPESVTVNSDIYIKPQNVLSLTLDTNSIIFDDFDGTENLEKLGAINLTVNSSLPYELNAYLASNIENSDKTSTMQKEILNLKSSSESEYKTFPDVGVTPIKLLDNQQPGTSNNHSIDIKLKASVLPKADVYKASIKFEVKQK